MQKTFQVKNGKKSSKVTFTNQQLTGGDLDGKAFQLDLVKTNTGFHVVQDGVCHQVDVLHVDHDAKKVELRINQKHYAYEIHDQFDELLHQLGMDKGAAGKVDQLKAPMPGLVLEIMVKPGDKVEEGQPLLILEAMKMENVIKSPGDGTIKAIGVSQAASVEKNQLLIEFA